MDSIDVWQCASSMRDSSTFCEPRRRHRGPLSALPIPDTRPWGIDNFHYHWLKLLAANRPFPKIVVQLSASSKRWYGRRGRRRSAEAPFVCMFRLGGNLCDRAARAAGEFPTTFMLMSSFESAAPADARGRDDASLERELRIVRRNFSQPPYGWAGSLFPHVLSGGCSRDKRVVLGRSGCVASP